MAQKTVPKRIFIFIFLLFFCFPAFCLEKDELQISSPSSPDSYNFTIDLASSKEDLANGLMHRKIIAEDYGMLFYFGSEKPAFMWMKNTLLPLDMLFINAEGVIVKIAKNTVPESEEVIFHPTPVRAVLEIKGGISDILGLKEGYIVKNKIFQSK